MENFVKFLLFIDLGKFNYEKIGFMWWVINFVCVFLGWIIKVIVRAVSDGSYVLVKFWIVNKKK